MMEDDDEVADGIVVRSVIHQTDTGPVEEKWEEHVWVNQHTPAAPNPINNNSCPPEDFTNFDQESLQPDTTE